jgi:hypothetical protein
MVAFGIGGFFLGGVPGWLALGAIVSGVVKLVVYGSRAVLQALWEGARPEVVAMGAMLGAAARRSVERRCDGG